MIVTKSARMRKIEQRRGSLSYGKGYAQEGGERSGVRVPISALVELLV